MKSQAVLVTTLYYFLILPGWTLVEGQDCLKHTVDACLESLKNDAYDLDQAIVPTMSKEDLEDHCRRYDLFADCMVQVKPYCKSLEKKSYEGIDDAYDYLCRTHKDEYLQHRDCFQNKDLHREGNTCNGTLERKLKELGPQTPNYKRDRICQYAEDYFDCVENTVESFCGRDAAEWQRGMDELSLKPLLTTIGCPNWLEQDNWLPILIGIVAALAVIIIITSVVMLILIRRKKKQNRAASQEHGNPDLPPPYAGPVTYGADSQAVQMGNGNQAGALPEKGPGLLPPPYYPGADQEMGLENPAYSELDMGGPSGPPPSLHRDTPGHAQPNLYDDTKNLAENKEYK